MNSVFLVSKGNRAIASAASLDLAFEYLEKRELGAAYYRDFTTFSRVVNPASDHYAELIVTPNAEEPRHAEKEVFNIVKIDHIDKPLT